jgi:hypothetical protein
MKTEMEEWLNRMLNQFVRQVKYSGSSAIWVLSKDRWEIARRAVETLIDRDVVVVTSSTPPNVSSALGNLEALANAAQTGDFVLVQLDDVNASHFISLMLQMVHYGGSIRKGESIMAFGVDDFTIHKDFYFSVFADPADYEKTLKSRIPKDRFGPAFYLNM